MVEQRKGQLGLVARRADLRHGRQNVQLVAHLEHLLCGTGAVRRGRHGHQPHRTQMVRQSDLELFAAVDLDRRQDRNCGLLSGFAGLAQSFSRRTGSAAADLAVPADLQIRIQQTVNIGKNEIAVVIAIEIIEDIRRPVIGQRQDAFIHGEQLDHAVCRLSFRRFEADFHFDLFLRHGLFRSVQHQSEFMTLLLQVEPDQSELTRFAGDQSQAGIARRSLDSRRELDREQVFAFFDRESRV